MLGMAKGIDVLKAREIDADYFKEVAGCYVLYHVTDVSNMGSVLFNGLRKRSGSRTTQLHENEGVYVFLKDSDAEDVHGSWLGSDIEAEHKLEFGDEFSGFAVFELHVPIEFVATYGVYDLEYDYELRFTCDVPKKYIRTVVYD